MNWKSWSCLFLLAGLTNYVNAQSVRDRTRPSYTKDTAVTESQAAELTLTLSPVAIRPVQTWVRTAAELDSTGKILIAEVYPPDAALIKVGQRAHSFTPDSKSSMSQARITRVVHEPGRVKIEAALPGEARRGSAYHVLEVFIERGEFLSIPNEAIIEEGDAQIVYVQQEPGRYLPQTIRTGLRGELYTEVVEGLKEGAQVVTFGSFFIDSEYKLKATAEVRSATP